MHTIEALFYVALTCAPDSIERGLKSKLLEERDKGRGALAQSICDKIDNDSAMVIVTELIGEAQERHRGSQPFVRHAPSMPERLLGVDEAVPATVPEPPPPSGDWKL